MYRTCSVALLLLLCAGQSDASVQLLWDWLYPIPNTFQVQRCTAPAGLTTCTVTTDLAGASVPGSVQTYTDTTTVVGTNYCWSVLAIEGGIRGPLASPAVCSPDITTGLVLYYPLDQLSGTSVPDQTAYANTGTLSGQTAWLSGLWGNAVSFAGPAAVLTTPPSPSLNTLPALSWAAWVYVRSWGTFHPRFVDKGGASTSGWWLTYDVPTSTRLRFAVAWSGTSVQMEIDSTPLTLNTWHHLVVTWDGGLTAATSMAMYVDKTKRLALSTTDGVGVRVSDATHPLLTANQEGGTAPLDATVEEIRVYNRALSQQDVDMLYTFVPPAPLFPSPKTVLRLLGK